MKNRTKLDPMNRFTEAAAKRASEDLPKWYSRHKNPPDKKKSEVEWLRVISKPTIDDVRKFYADFSLGRNFGKEYGAVVCAIGSFGALSGSPASRIDQLAEMLRKSSRKKSRQTSAASKLATFLKPTEDIYVWDSFAREAVIEHNLDKQGRDGYQRSRAYISKNSGDHMYNYYWSDSHALFKETKKLPVFSNLMQQALKEIEASKPLDWDFCYYRGFLERRFFDKYLWHLAKDIRCSQRA